LVSKTFITKQNLNSEDLWFPGKDCCSTLYLDVERDISLIKMNLDSPMGYRFHSFEISMVD